MQLLMCFLSCYYIEVLRFIKESFSQDNNTSQM